MMEEAQSYEEDGLEHQQVMTIAEDTILGCLDRGMQILGNSGMHAVYHVMKSEFRMAREEIPGNPHSFVAVLRKIFGIGGRVLQERILEELNLLKSTEIETAKLVRFFVSVLYADLNTQLTEARKD